MSVYQKLNEARSKFHSLELKKTGENKFAGYKYFELGDFLTAALNVFKEVGLCAVVSFDREIASMKIIDVDKPESSLVITSPMGSANLKGCHEVQNIGAVETYQRRYLWVAALEIVEHDALDPLTGSDAGRPQKPGVIKGSDGAMASLSEKQQQFVAKIAAAIAKKMGAGEDWGAYEELTSALESVKKNGGDANMFKVALWAVLDSGVRRALESMEASENN